jgi:DNA-binding GntR family transcriptional regulator
LNREFHQGIITASGNPLMGKIYRVVTNSFPDWMLYEYMFRHPELLEASLAKEYQEHKALIETIAAGEAEAAAACALVHMINLGKDLVKFLGIPESALQYKQQELGPLFVG